MRLTVYPADYLKLLDGGNFIHFIAIVKADNDVSAVETHNLRLKVWLTACYSLSIVMNSSSPQTPDISITLPTETLKLYQPVSLQVAFRNPLSKTLYNGRFQLLGETYVQPASVQIQ